MTAVTPGPPPRDHHAELVHREFTGWAEAQGYDDQGRFDHDEMEFAFESGWEAADAVVAQRDFTGEILGELRNALGTDPDAEQEAGEAPEAFAIRLVHYLKERIDELHGLIATPEPQAAQAVAADRIIRDILESLCRRDGLSLESTIEPGEPARNYALAERLGIGHVFGLPPEPQPQPAPGDVLCVTPGDGTPIGGLMAHVGLMPQPAPELAPVDSAHLYHWRFDRGEEFGLYRQRADADAMAAKHTGEGLSEVLSLAILGRPEQPAPELAAAMAALADALEAEGREETAIAGKRAGEVRTARLERGDVFQLCASRIRRVAGIEAS